MAACKNRFSKTTNLLALLGVGIGSGLLARYLWNRSLQNVRDREHPDGELSKTGSVPHTDYDAAAKIGRQTGGEVFDD